VQYDWWVIQALRHQIYHEVIFHQIGNEKL